MAKLSPQELYQKSLNIWWWHSVPLGDGLFTKGNKPNQRELLEWKFPADLKGKTVLDIGCNDGGFLVAALQRGASRALGIDATCTPGMQFLLEHEVYPFEFQVMDLFSDAFLALPPFDFVIFAGVLYHTKNPLEALVRLRRVTKELALIESHIDERESRFPCMFFYEKNEVANDPSNWWGPNRRCLEAMLRVAGFGWVHMTDLKMSRKGGMGRIAYLAAPAPGSAEPPIQTVVTPY
jgi:tRNA (mo5U34)-methyltransferase